MASLTVFRRRRADARERAWQVAQLPALLSALARALRRGATLHQALVEVGNDPAVAGASLRAGVATVERGAAAAEAIDGWASELDHPDADVVRAVLRVGLGSGAALAAALDQAAGSLRDRADLAREVSALASQARASALVLTLAPVAFLLLMALADPGILTSTIASTAGRAALCLGLVLDGVGWWWMRRLVEGVSR